MAMALLFATVAMTRSNERRKRTLPGDIDIPDVSLGLAVHRSSCPEAAILGVTCVTANSPASPRPQQKNRVQTKSGAPRAMALLSALIFITTTAVARDR